MDEYHEYGGDRGDGSDRIVHAIERVEAAVKQKWSTLGSVVVILIAVYLASLLLEVLRNLRST
jgi:hypothetical protein